MSLSWTPKRIVSGLFAGVFFMNLLLALSLPGTAHAAGESLRWTDNTAVEISGGDLRSAGSLTTTAPNNTVLFGNVTHESGCGLRLQLNVLPGNTRGTLSVPTSMGGSAPSNPCGASVTGGYRSVQVNIQGPRPDAGGAAETQLQKTVSITLNSPTPARNSPAQVTFTLRTSFDFVLQTRTVPQQETGSDQNPDPGARAVLYTTSFIVNPGAYKICASEIITECRSFTKEQYVAQHLTMGESLSGRSVEVRVVAEYANQTGASRTLSMGPLTLVMSQGGEERSRVDTNTDSPSASTANPIVLGVSGTFTSVSPGVYDICVTAVNVCRSFTKAANLSDSIEIRITGAQASQIVTGGTDDEEYPVCEASPNSLSWVACPVFNGISKFSDWVIQDVLVPFIRPTPIGLNPNDPATGITFRIWSAFRVYGNIILVILLLVAIISQAIGGGLVEAYTARKMLPRILIAGILVNVSIYVVALGVDLSHVIGNGIADLITAPLVQTGEFNFSPTNGQVFAVTSITVLTAALIPVLIASGALAAIAPFILIFIALPAFLALLGVFFILVILQALVMALVIFSPIAFALYCLPNTERYFRLWWEWLFNALVIYPIFMALVGIADVFTVLIQRTNGGGV